MAKDRCMNRVLQVIGFSCSETIEAKYKASTPSCEEVLNEKRQRPRRGD